MRRSPARKNRRDTDEIKKKAIVVASVVAAVIVVIQLVPVTRDNPPVVADFNGPEEVRAVLKTSCYDCHSNETRWPWYSHVAPVSWLIAHDVEEAREHLNLSRWGTYDPARQEKLAEDMWEEVEEGEMPLLVYRLGHRDAALSDANKATLRDWSLSVRGGS